MTKRSCKKRKSIDMCDTFCKTDYITRFKASRRKQYKTSKYFSNMKLSKKEIEKAVDRRVPEALTYCKQNYCNLNCPHIGKNKSSRYFCPLCRERHMDIEKLGALTYCQYDPDLYGLAETPR